MARSKYKVSFDHEENEKAMNQARDGIDSAAERLTSITNPGIEPGVAQSVADRRAEISAMLSKVLNNLNTSTAAARAIQNVDEDAAADAARTDTTVLGGSGVGRGTGGVTHTPAVSDDNFYVPRKENTPDSEPVGSHSKGVYSGVPRVAVPTGTVQSVPVSSYVPQNYTAPSYIEPARHAPVQYAAPLAQAVNQAYLSGYQPTPTVPTNYPTPQPVYQPPVFDTSAYTQQYGGGVADLAGAYNSGANSVPAPVITPTVQTSSFEPVNFGHNAGMNNMAWSAYTGENIDPANRAEAYNAMQSLMAEKSGEYTPTTYLSDGPADTRADYMTSTRDLALDNTRNELAEIGRYRAMGEQQQLAAIEAAQRAAEAELAQQAQLEDLYGEEIDAEGGASRANMAALLSAMAESDAEAADEHGINLGENSTQSDLNAALSKDELRDVVYEILKDAEENGELDDLLSEEDLEDFDGVIGPISGPADAEAVIKLANEYASAGIPYAWGGGHGAEPGISRGISDGGGAADAHGDYNKNGLDCSGLARDFIWNMHGVDINGTAAMQIGNSDLLPSWEDAEPGDLWSPHDGHIGIYIGDGKVLEAQQSGTDVLIRPLSDSELASSRFGRVRGI